MLSRLTSTTIGLRSKAQSRHQSNVLWRSHRPSVARKPIFQLSPCRKKPQHSSITHNHNTTTPHIRIVNSRVIVVLSLCCGCGCDVVSWCCVANPLLLCSGFFCGKVGTQATVRPLFYVTATFIRSCNSTFSTYVKYWTLSTVLGGLPGLQLHVAVFPVKYPWKLARLKLFAFICQRLVSSVDKSGMSWTFVYKLLHGSNVVDGGKISNRRRTPAVISDARYAPYA